MDDFLEYTLEQYSTYRVFLRSGNALDFYLYQRGLEDTTRDALYNSFEPGHKVKDKDLVDQLVKDGLKVLIDTAVSLEASLIIDDESGIEEILSEFDGLALDVIRANMSNEGLNYLDSR